MRLNSSTNDSPFCSGIIIGPTARPLCVTMAWDGFGGRLLLTVKLVG
ncbi:hypothetical protein RSSM_03837 [Rhodopirellula sallentina SM41]|uniref:Uncharacterized protein n=1 Tax=Rhodopirellula sallentina SM41 TaxID=1263870 RepID=M5UA64_9BACT|nr:hypothetical protein RSSM_03837 [Rhodopirellula sallentina SM41]